MNTDKTTSPASLQKRLKTLWGAQQMPFFSAATQPYLSQTHRQLLARLEQMLSIHSSGIVHGPNGVGKSYLISHFTTELNPKAYRIVTLSHSTLRGTGLLRMLCMLLGKKPKFRREDNLKTLSDAFSSLVPVWPIIVLEEAQNLTADALEELRLLSLFGASKTKTPFSFIFVGDENLMPRLMMGINDPLISRLGFALEVHPLGPQQVPQYIQCRLAEVGMHGQPFSDAATQMLVDASAGIPRIINNIAQRAIEAAAMVEQNHIEKEHIQQALQTLPWLTKIAGKNHQALAT